MSTSRSLLQGDIYIDLLNMSEDEQRLLIQFLQKNRDENISEFNSNQKYLVNVKNCPKINSFPKVISIKFSHELSQIDANVFLDDQIIPNKEITYNIYAPPIKEKNQKKLPQGNYGSYLKKNKKNFLGKIKIITIHDDKKNEDKLQIIFKPIKAKPRGRKKGIKKQVIKNTYSGKKFYDKIIREGQLTIQGNPDSGIKGVTFSDNNKIAQIEMYHLEGMDLFDVIDGDPKVTIPTETRFLMVKAFFEDLQKLHDNGINHRDLKPENIRVDFFYYPPKITIFDMGLAKKMDEDDTGSSVGTRLYYSYESYRGRKTTNQSDMHGAVEIAAAILGETILNEIYAKKDKDLLDKRICNGRTFLSLFKGMDDVSEECKQEIQNLFLLMGSNNKRPKSMKEVVESFNAILKRHHLDEEEYTESMHRLLPFEGFSKSLPVRMALPVDDRVTLHAVYWHLNSQIELIDNENREQVALAVLRFLVLGKADIVTLQLDDWDDQLKNKIIKCMGLRYYDVLESESSHSVIIYKKDKVVLNDLMFVNDSSSLINKGNTIHTTFYLESQQDVQFDLYSVNLSQTEEISLSNREKSLNHLLLPEHNHSVFIMGDFGAPMMPVPEEKHCIVSSVSESNEGTPFYKFNTGGYSSTIKNCSKDSQVRQMSPLKSRTLDQNTGMTYQEKEKNSGHDPFFVTLFSNSERLGIIEEQMQANLKNILDDEVFFLRETVNYTNDRGYALIIEAEQPSIASDFVLSLKNDFNLLLEEKNTVRDKKNIKTYTVHFSNSNDDPNNIIKSCMDHLGMEYIEQQKQEYAKCKMQQSLLKYWGEMKPLIKLKYIDELDSLIQDNHFEYESINNIIKATKNILSRENNQNIRQFHREMMLLTCRIACGKDKSLIAQYAEIADTLVRAIEKIYVNNNVFGSTNKTIQRIYNYLTDKTITVPAFEKLINIQYIIASSYSYSLLFFIDSRTDLFVDLIKNLNFIPENLDKINPFQNIDTLKSLKKR